MSDVDAPASPPANLLERAKLIETQAQRIEVRKRTDSEDSALSEALDAFEKQRKILRPLVEQAGALRGHGDEVAVPDPVGSIRGIEKLADAIDIDPTAVRRRRNQLNQLEKLVAEARGQVGEAVQTRLRDAKRDANPSLVGLLRMGGLEKAAEELDAALGTLDDLAADGPRTVEDWQRVDAAAAAIDEAVSESGTPLLEFTRGVLGGEMTLADLDDELLVELKRQGAAKNFAIKLSSG
jgi:DNA repair ATPase RecN